jgi:hypothetical protein
MIKEASGSSSLMLEVTYSVQEIDNSLGLLKWEGDVCCKSVGIQKLAPPP